MPNSPKYKPKTTEQQERQRRDTPNQTRNKAAHYRERHSTERARGDGPYHEDARARHVTPAAGHAQETSSRIVETAAASDDVLCIAPESHVWSLASLALDRLPFRRAEEGVEW